jgi:hypothetical protein
METDREPEVAPRPPTAYEPPRIEAALTDERLAREVHYAGTTPPP